MAKVEELTVYLLPAHRLVLQTLARREAKTPGAVVRRLIQAEGERQGLWPAKGAKGGGQCPS